MKICGFQKQSLKDYPGKISSIIFTSGCNFRCGYCHNPGLVNGDLKEVSEEEVLEYLNKRKNLLDGVVITGGEPTIHNDLIDFVRRVKNIGLCVKLDTNGSNPSVLKKLADENLIDYIAMDYKYNVDDYKDIIGVDFDLSLIEKSRDILLGCDIDYEFRVTVVEELFDDDVIDKIKLELKDGKIKFQKFRNDVVLDEKFKHYKNTGDDFIERLV